MADDDAPPKDAGSPAVGIGDGESNVFKNPDDPAPAAENGQGSDAPPAAADGGGGGMDDEEYERPEQFDVHYTCLRCGTDVSNDELGRLPEIKCICGYKVFIKMRPPIVKTVSAV